MLYILKTLELLNDLTTRLCGRILILVKTDKKDDVKYYSGRIKSVLFYKNIAYILIKTIGVDKAKHIGEKIEIIGFLGLFISFIFLLILNGLGISLLDYPYNFYILAFFVVLILIGFLVFVSPADYYKSTICERCNSDFAYKEDCKPDIRKIKTKNGTVTKYVTRTYKCGYCKNKKIVTEKKVIEPIYYSDMV